MPIIHDKKKMLGVILSGMDGNNQEVKEESSMDEHDEALKLVASELIKAIEEKSALGVVDALKALISEIQEMDEEQDEEMQEEKEEE
jgi:hypothetical protein